MDINGMRFQIRPMPPREQFHVARRLAPLVGRMSDGILALLDDSKPKSETMAKLAGAIGPLTDALAFMPNDVVDYILDACLVCVDRMDDTDQQWHPIYVKQPKGTIRMYQDIDAMMELELVEKVIRANLAPFIARLSGESESSVNANALPRK